MSELTPKTIPSIDGFSAQLRTLYPGLAPELVERFAHEQVQRYTRLMEIKQQHARAVLHHACPSGPYCFEQSGNSKLLPPSAKRDGVGSIYWTVPSLAGEDIGRTAQVPAVFDPGIPPPRAVTHIPSAFECPVCFQVITIRKPNDWTKHHFHDLRPFSCTFLDCLTPRSFKRPADWFRHEHVRHRCPEWWGCETPGCSFQCPRGDRFAHHLVRVHNLHPGTLSKDAGSGSTEVDQFKTMLDRCRHVVLDKPSNEPCCFCGAVFTTRKDSNRHVNQHFLDISLAILNLVNDGAFPMSSPSQGESAFASTA